MDGVGVRCLGGVVVVVVSVGVDVCVVVVVGMGLVGMGELEERGLEEREEATLATSSRLLVLVSSKDVAARSAGGRGGMTRWCWNCRCR